MPRRASRLSRRGIAGTWAKATRAAPAGAIAAGAGASTGPAAAARISAMASHADATGAAIETIGGGRFLRLVRRGKWEFVERTNASGATAIVALTDEGRLVLIEQPRPALGGVAIELPAGLVGDTPGDEGEEMARAAGRELTEETGFEAREIVQVASGPSSPGLTSETISIFVATGLTKVGPGGGVESEEITVFEVPLGEVEAFLAEKIARGAHVDLKVWAGLYFAHRALQGR